MTSHAGSNLSQSSRSTSQAGSAHAAAAAGEHPVRTACRGPGADGKGRCDAPVKIRFVFLREAIRPRAFCEAHAESVRALMSRKLHKQDWREERLTGTKWTWMHAGWIEDDSAPAVEVA
jgi:hypothetical protein